MVQQLDKIFKPSSIAVIGASSQEASVGYAVFKNLLTSGFEGPIYPVNLKHDTVQGKTAYRSIGKVPEKVDLAVITTPASAVPHVVEDCGEAGVGGLLIISAGFKEMGEPGQKMVDQILATAQKYDMRIIGPNCLGFINPNLGINASFATKMPLQGSIAFISQSGALCTSILDWAVDQNVGFSHFVSIGSMIDIGFEELIDYFGMDQNTSSILIYMESLKDARKFMSASRAFARSKPIIILKAGRSEEGGHAALSHTGTLAGNNAVFNAAFQRAGIIRVETIGQLFNCAQALAMQPRPQGNRLAILTNAGGPGVLATDYLIEYGGQLAKLSEKTMKELDDLLPPHWSRNNPVDVLGDASSETYRKAAEICLRDENIDGILAVLVTQAITDPTDVARELVEVAKTSRKTILASWMGEEDVAQGREILEQGNVPNYRYPESAVDVFLRMYHYSRNLEMLQETPTEIPQRFSPRRDAAWRIIRSVLEADRRQMTESEAKELMQCYEIPVCPNLVAATVEEAKAFALKIGYPVVLKIASPDIGHKTDVGGVRIDINNSEALEKAYKEILESVKEHRPDAHIDGILVEKMVKKEFELLIGAKKDSIFGPVIAFGQGGIAVEVLRDTQLGLPPLNMALARRIIKGTRIFPLLKGYRGRKGVDLEQLAFILVKFAYLTMDFPEIREIDINPFVADDQEGMVLDAHIVLDDYQPRRKGHPYDHLVISPYPEKYIRPFVLENGKEVLLRPIRPEDEPLEAEMFEYLSSQTLYFRFFGYIPRVTHEFLTRFTQIDYDREMAIIAEVEEGNEKKMAGVARVISDAWGETAEFAIVIADPWQGKGLGSIMTDYILEIARDKGIKTIYASVMAANKRMLQMFENRGFLLSREERDIYHAELDLEHAMPFTTGLPYIEY